LKFDLDYAREVIKAEAMAVNDVIKVVNGQFEKAVEMVFNCKGSVIISGIGKAGLIGQKISATMASTGTPSHFLHPAEAVHGDLGRLRNEDIVIVLSHGGETDEITRLINLVKQLGIPLISITAEEDSTLGKYSDVVLCMGKQNEACPLGVAPSVSTTCMLAIGDAIAFTVMKARDFGVEDYVRFHPGGSLGAKLMTVEQSMMFKPDEVLPIASAESTIAEILNETKDVKRHGAVMIVDKKGELAGIITDGDLRRAFSNYQEKTFGLKAAKIMTAGCKRIKLHSLASEATAIFHKYRIDELPVVDEFNKPVGMIDVQDIVTIKIVG
jgi:arabinose-5-phosphate isomerase